MRDSENVRHFQHKSKYVDAALAIVRAQRPLGTKHFVEVMVEITSQKGDVVPT